MEITTVTYRKLDETRTKYSGDFKLVEGGLVLYLSANSQSFIPFHRIEAIDQTFTQDIPYNERMNKSLANRMARHQ